MVAANGEVLQIIDPTTGKPFEGYRNGFAVPPVITSSSILNQALETYSAIRRDDAMAFSRRDALAMERDCFLQGMMQERYLATALLKWHLEPENPKDPAEQEYTQFLQKIVERTPFFQQYRMSCLYAIWYGRAGVQHIIGQDNMKGFKVWRIKDHAPVRGDKIEFTFQIDDDKESREGWPTVLVNPAHTGKIERMGGKIVRTDLNPALLLTPGYWRERFTIHKHQTKDNDPFDEPEKAGTIHGFGVRDQIFYLDWIRKEWLSNVSDFIDQVGRGAQIVPYDASNPQNEAAALKAWKEQSRNTVIMWPVWPSSGEALLPKPFGVPMDGSQILLSLMGHIEAIEERYIIGQTGSSRDETSGLGTHSGDAMQDTKYRLVRWDAQNLEERLTEDLVQPLHHMNNPKADFKVYFKFDIDKPNALEMLQAGGQLYQMNVPMKQDELRGYAGYSKPEAGDAVVQQPQPLPQAPSQQLMQRLEAMERYNRPDPVTQPPIYVHVENPEQKPNNVYVSVPERSVNVQPPANYIRNEFTQPAINIQPGQVVVNPTPLHLHNEINPSSLYLTNQVRAGDVHVGPTPLKVENVVNPTPLHYHAGDVNVDRTPVYVNPTPVVVQVPERKPAKIIRDDEGRVAGLE